MYVHAHICSCIVGIWIEDPQIKLKVSFLISCDDKTRKFIKFLTVACQLWFWNYNLPNLVIFWQKESAGNDTIYGVI